MTQDESTRSGTLMRAIRRMPAFQQCVPMEAGLGPMLPWRKDGRVYVTVPFFGMPPARVDGKTQLYAPFATMTIDWERGSVVGYRNLLVDGLWPASSEPVGTFPHDAVATLRRSQYLALREELFRHYDELCRFLAAGDEIPPEWSARFTELLRQLVEPALAPYYRILAPNFMDRFLGGG